VVSTLAPINQKTRFQAFAFNFHNVCRYDQANALSKEAFKGKGFLPIPGMAIGGAVQVS
jgi:hypothetical protein